jgi:hypothetical protein
MRPVLRNVGKLVVIWAGQGVVGWIAVQGLQAVDPSPLRDAILVLIWPIAMISGSLLAAIWLLRSPAEQMPMDRYGGIRPEWATATQSQHWEGVRKLALEAYAEFRRVIAAPTVIVRERNSLQSLIDEVDAQVGQYGALWAGSSYWN